MLNISHLSKSFAQKKIAQDIHLSVQAGEFVAILGQSGCGKSTLLKMISGLVTPDSGSIELNGKDITRLPAEKRQISLMFQDYALFPHLNVIDNITFGLKMRGIPQKAAYQQVFPLLESIGLANEAYRAVTRLSGGEQQRISLARALITQPQALLLDEAFSSLDTQLRHKLREQTREHIQKHQIPTILVTHDPNEACTLADKIALMHDGKIIQMGTSDTLITQPASYTAAILLGLHNISSTFHIPQTALTRIKNENTAVSYPIQKITPSTHGYFITFIHPQYGYITWQSAFKDDISTLNHAGYIAIEIDESKIIQFKP